MFVLGKAKDLSRRHITGRPQRRWGDVFAQAPVSPKGWLTEPRKAAIAANGDMT